MFKLTDIRDAWNAFWDKQKQEVENFYREEVIPSTLNNARYENRDKPSILFMVSSMDGDVTNTTPVDGSEVYMVKDDVSSPDSNFESDDNGDFKVNKG